jgi:hypothetical protein
MCFFGKDRKKRKEESEKMIDERECRKENREKRIENR